MSEDPAEHVVVETVDQIRTIRFNRPEKKNAFTVAMYSAIVEAFESASADDGVRVVLLRGTAGVFTAGNDLMDFMKVPLTTESPVFKLLLTMSSFEKPIVAAVEGPAIGFGTTMLMHCDFAYAGEGTRLQTPFVNFGLCPEAASSFLLPRMAGHRRASELLLLGEPFDAATALDCRIVNAVVADDAVIERALETATALAAKPPSSLRLIKRLLKEGTRERVEQTIFAEGEEFLSRLSSPEAAEAFAAFFERRKPDFSRFS